MTVCGIGGWGGPLPGDPSNNSVLSASPAFGGIDVSWSYPTTNPNAVAHVQLYRNIFDDLANAPLLAIVAGDRHYDKTNSSTEYFYWIRIVSVNGTVGAPIGPASAIGRPVIQDVIAGLTGQIDDGNLSVALKSQIDKIALNYQEFTQEVTNRVEGEETISSFLQQVEAGTEGLSALVNEEVVARVSANSAIASQITTVQSVLEGNIASVQNAMETSIDSVTGKVNAIWSAKVNVNGLVGGFGLVNDGTLVEAGFDVDRFWVGRTNANKRKPFIIENDVVYIDEAAINKLTFSKLRDESGSFIVENDQVKATYIDTKGLSIKDSQGNIVFSSGVPLDWDRINGTGKPQNNATRNVFRGEWETATAYAVGDIVIQAGYGWSAIADHVSSASVMPPVFPTNSNTNWVLYTVKGDTGVPGANGTRTAVLDMYRNSAAAPTTFPAGNSTYTWATGQFTAPATTNIWSLVPPAPVAGQDLWVVRQLYSDNNTSTTSDVGWAATTSRISAASGEPGTDGINGARTAYLEVYQWAVSIPTTFPSGTSTYTWATGVFTAPTTPASWSLLPGAQVPGQTLWACAVRLTNNTTVSTDTVTWNTNQAFPIGSAGTNGNNAVVAILSNESHTFPAAFDGTVSSYVGSGTQIRVYEGAVEIFYDGVGTANGTWKVVSAVSNITRGALTDSGNFLTVADHSAVATATDVSSITYTITGKTISGTAFTLVKAQTFSKSKAGSNGSPGSAGPTVLLTSNRPSSFTATDGFLDSAQPDLVLTANTQGLVSPTFVWSFSGLETNPTASTTASQTITAAQFGSSKSAIVTCTVNSTFVDAITIVRLERSTAAAGATVGATIGTNLNGQITFENVSSYIADAAIGTAQVGTLNADVITVGTLRAGIIDVQKLIGSSTAFNAPGSGTFTVPSGMTRLAITVKGAGGGGGAGGTGNVANQFNNASTGGNGGSGGRGGMYRAVFDVVPGQTVSYFIGTAGTGGVGGSRVAVSPSGTAGGASTFTIAGTTYTAGGGGGGGGGFRGSFSTGATGANGAAGTPGTGGGTGGNGLGSPGGVGGLGVGGNGQALPGSAGTNGENIFENYQVNGLVSRTEWENLMTHMTQRFNTYTWP